MTGLYVDSSALLTRVFREEGSSTVREVLRTRNAAGDLIAASELAWVEVSRALLRAGVPDVAAALADACSGVARQPIDPVVMVRARSIGAPTLRSLDAIHLAAAMVLGCTELLTFDDRLAEAATAVGITAVPADG